MRTQMMGAAVCALLLMGAGCDDGTEEPTDAGTTTPDSGTPSGSDAGPTSPDAGPGETDAGTSSDPCAASSDDPLSSLGCNGGVYGSTPMANEIGGDCTPDGMDPPGPGSCATTAGEATPVCSPDEADPSTGTCIYVCPPAGTYVSTGGCPSGSRCFTLDAELAICFRDCNDADDCFEGEECDAEGSCVASAPAADGGAAPTDGGVPVDGGAG